MFRLVPRRVAFSATLLPLLACFGCSSGGGGGEIVATTPTLNGLELRSVVTGDTRLSPAVIRIVVADAQSKPVELRLAFALPTDPTLEIPVTAIALPNPLSLPSSPAGVTHEIVWEFRAEPSLPTDGHFVDGVRLIARLATGAQRSITLGLGNDAPSVALGSPALTANGIVDLPLTVADSSDDATRLRVEFLDLDDPVAAWRLARPVGLGAGESTPEFAVDPVAASRVGATVTFAWDSAFDLPAVDHRVLLRVTPDDSIVSGPTMTSGEFLLDNNQEPVVDVDFDAFVVGDDTRRGVPIGYELRDAEGDPSRVLFQWRRAEETDFAPLGTDDPMEILAHLDDPDWARERRICRWFPNYARGELSAVDAVTLRAPALAREASFAGQDLVGRPIEFLHPSTPAPRASLAWDANPLLAPVAAIPTASGRRALVLDRSPNGASLLELDLETGQVVRSITNAIVGEPTALALGLDRKDALVATDLGGSWELTRVELESGTTTSILAFAGDPLHAIASLGTNAALAVSDATLWRIDWHGATPSIATIATGLANARGLALDPRRRDRAWVAERDAVVQQGVGQILSIDLHARTAVPVSAAPRSLVLNAFPSVTSIAYCAERNRLLAICRPDGSPTELVQFSLGRSANDVVQLGVLEDTAHAIGLGDEGSFVVTLPGLADLRAGGGIATSRTITAYDPARCELTLDRPWAPDASGLPEFRIPVRRGFRDALVPGPDGVPGTFVWDSSEVVGGGPVHLRATTFDTQRGTTVDSVAPHAVTDLDDHVSTEILLGESSVAPFTTRADLDADGSLDLITTSPNDSLVRVWLKRSARSFESAPLILDATGASDIREAVVADLDDDGDLDLIVGNALLFQTRPGAFESSPLILDGLGTATVADLDDDGDVDLVASLGDRVRLWYQTGHRVFELDPFELVDPGVGAVLDRPRVADVDRDGDVDIVVGSSLPSHLLVFLQLGIGEFDPLPMVLDAPPGAVSAEDIDGDGDTDIVTDDGFELRRFVQTEPGTFAPATILPGLSAPLDVVDLDLDGRLDFVGGSGNALRQLAGDVFEPHPTFASTPKSDGIADDFDGDGHLDFAGFSDAPPRLTVQFARNSIETKSSTIGDAGTTPSPNSIATADLDGDGLLDLAFTAGSPTTVRVAYGRGSGEFTQPVTIAALASITGIRSVDLADVDGDGRVDVLVASADQDVCAIARRTAAGTFDTTPIVLGGPGTTTRPHHIRCL
ncbi:MAG: VCBS repeat-containing protein, partial [Planctomycetes bacterium]|nr:VCBS repeat-containing protein [Planctomycetota bacterium]